MFLVTYMFLKQMLSSTTKIPTAYTQYAHSTIMLKADISDIFQNIIIILPTHSLKNDYNMPQYASDMNIDWMSQLRSIS